MAGESVRIANLNAVLRALSRMPKEASDGLRDEAQGIAQDIVSRAQGKASKRRGPDTSHQTFGDIFFGAEFGGSRGSIAALGGAAVGESKVYRSGLRLRTSLNRGSTRQFPPHRGRQGYWLYPTIRDMNAEITDRYHDALDRALVRAGAR
jgi:hypothetical protein